MITQLTAALATIQGNSASFDPSKLTQEQMFLIIVLYAVVVKGIKWTKYLSEDWSQGAGPQVE